MERSYQLKTRNKVLNITYRSNEPSKEGIAKLAKTIKGTVHRHIKEVA